MSYRFKRAYPQAKRLLNSGQGFAGGIKELLKQAEEDFVSPLWEELAAQDFQAEYERFAQWWPKPKSKEFPEDEYVVLFLGLEDVPYGFDLRGSSTWSRNPDDWGWCYTDEMLGMSYGSEIMRFALDRAEALDKEAERHWLEDDRAETNFEVVEMFFSLGLYGLLMRELIRQADRKLLLGGRSERWVVLGHPDAEYGIILGKATQTGWEPFWVDRSDSS